MKSGKVRNTAQSTKMADGIYPKLYIFNTPVQKEENLPGFHVHTVCNLLLGHSSELKVILNQIRFVYFSAFFEKYNCRCGVFTDLTNYEDYNKTTTAFPESSTCNLNLHIVTRMLAIYTTGGWGG